MAESVTSFKLAYLATNEEKLQPALKQADTLH